MTVRLALLGLLNDRLSHGYRLKARYDALVDPDASVQPAQIYNTLTRLERDGLIEQTETEQDAGPARRIYGLTDSGRAELHRWLGEPVEPAAHLQALLYTKVVLTILAGQPIEPLLDAQREAHLVRMRELTGLRHSRSTATAALAEYSLFHLEADLKWLEVMAGQIDELVDGVAVDERRGRR
jgi:DNA-binding PadR family transcriptional regulator